MSPLLPHTLSRDVALAKARVLAPPPPLLRSLLLSRRRPSEATRNRPPPTAMAAVAEHCCAHRLRLGGEATLALKERRGGSRAELCLEASRTATQTLSAQAAA